MEERVLAVREGRESAEGARRREPYVEPPFATGSLVMCEARER